MKKPFIEEFEVIQDSRSAITSNCNSFYMENIGTSTINLGGKDLLPGDSYYSPGNEDEFNTTIYQVIYTTPGIDRLWIVRKSYK